MTEFTNDKKQPFLKKGKMVEQAFTSLFEKSNTSTSKEDQLEHWDVEFTTKVDVKGLKKVKRGDVDVNEHIHWLEIKNISGGLGSCYTGLATFVVFELKKYWVIVSKEDLQNFIKENVIKEFTEQPTLYKLYRRKGRLDVLTLVTSYDLCYISDCIIKKKIL